MKMKELMLAVLLTLASASAEAQQTDCLPEKYQEGAAYGTATFIGEPIKGVWEDGAPFFLAGHQLRLNLGDEIVVYGAENTENARDLNSGWADNLSGLTIILDGADGVAVRYRDGSIVVVNNDNCIMSWPLRRNFPTTPVTQGDVAPDLMVECMSFFGVMEYQLHDWRSASTNWVTNPIGKGRMFLGFGPDIYALGFDTWGKYWLIPMSTCGASVFSGAP